jgi:hypothetical protein
MTDEPAPVPDKQYVTYTIASLGADRWFVDSNRGTSGYSFHSLADAERFAITLAKKNSPCKVCILDSNGNVVKETVFDQPADAGT